MGAVAMKLSLRGRMESIAQVGCMTDSAEWVVWFADKQQAVADVVAASNLLIAILVEAVRYYNSEQL